MLLSSPLLCNIWSQTSIQLSTSQLYRPVPIYKVLGKELRKVADPGSTSSLTGRTVELKRAEIGLTGGSAGEPALATIFSGARGVGKTAMLDHFTIMVRNHITKTWGHGRLSQSPSIQTVQPMRKPSMAGSVISSAGENGSVPFVVLYISAEISETEIGPWAVFLETLLTVSESYYSTPRKIANNPTSGPPKSLPSSPKLGPNRAPAYSTMDAGSRKGGRKDSTSSAMLMEHILRLEDKNEDKDDDSAVNGGPRKSLVHRNSVSRITPLIYQRFAGRIAMREVADAFVSLLLFSSLLFSSLLFSSFL